MRESKAIEVELLNYRKDGTPFFNHFVILPLFKGKKCTHFVAVQKDITALRQSSDPRDWYVRLRRPPFSPHTTQLT